MPDVIRQVNDRAPRVASGGLRLPIRRLHQDMVKPSSAAVY